MRAAGHRRDAGGALPQLHEGLAADQGHLVRRMEEMVLANFEVRDGKIYRPLSIPNT